MTWKKEKIAISLKISLMEWRKPKKHEIPFAIDDPRPTWPPKIP